jgi:hypothetical protein
MVVEKHRSLEILNIINIKMLLNKSGKMYSSLLEVTHIFPTALYVIFFSFGATAPIWALAYLHETHRFTSIY